MSPTFVAVDWSGARDPRRAIWLAEVVEGRLRRLEGGRGRGEVVEHLVERAARDPHLVVGLDFAFSFPDWFLREHGVESGRGAWDLAARRGEDWLATCPPPFWGRPGRGRPDVDGLLRRTELEAGRVPGARPKSVFQIGGAGAVGTASLRGMPYLTTLAGAGFSIWPFDPPAWPLVVEIYPRLLLGKVRKSDPGERTEYLERSWPGLEEDLAARAAGSEHALDAAVSARVMARHLDPRSLPRTTDPVVGREGWIWWPTPLAAEGWQDAVQLRLDDAVDLLSRTPAVLRTWLRGLPERWLRHREGPGTWSPHEVVGHLVHGERTDWMPRLRQMLEGRGDEPFDPFDRFAMLRAATDRPTDDLLDELVQLRRRNLDDLRALHLGPERLDAPGLHPALGPVTARELLATWVAHDQTHVAQIARVISKQYRAEVGPWRAYLPLLDRT